MFLQKKVYHSGYYLRRGFYKEAREKVDAGQ